MTIDTTGSEDAWQRQALVEVTDGTSTMALGALTQTINIEGGGRDLDVIDLLNLGQIPKHGSSEPITITIEGYPLEAGSAATGTGTGYFDIFASKPVADSSDPLAIDMSNTLTKYRVAILWTDDSAATTGGGATAASTAGIRFVLAECFCISCNWDFTDRILKKTLVFKGVAFDKAASANAKGESHTNGAIPTLGSYTPGTTKWA